MTYKYPVLFEDIKDGDAIQIQFPLTDRWGEEKVYDSNICDSKKERIKYLIEHKRIRIVIK